MRCFLSVATPRPVWERREFPRAQTHLTVRFLDELDDAMRGRVTEALPRIAATQPSFRLVLRSAGVFPDLRRPRVVWAGVAEGRRELEALCERANRELEPVGIPADPRPFVAHVTLFRVHSAREAEDARALVEELEGVELGRTTVTALDLKSSTLSPHGARHETLATAEFAPGPDASEPPPTDRAAESGASR